MVEAAALYLEDPRHHHAVRLAVAGGEGGARHRAGVVPEEDGEDQPLLLVDDGEAALPRRLDVAEDAGVHLVDDAQLHRLALAFRVEHRLDAVLDADAARQRRDYVALARGHAG